MKIMGRNKQQTENLNQIRNLPIAQVQPNPMQPRKYFSQEELASLAASIRENGLLQPITVRAMEGHYELVAGERRLRASKLAGLTVIPAIVLRMDDNQSAILSLVENIQRADLNFVEEALAIKRLMAQYSYTQEDVARLLGKNQSTVANKLRILRLSPRVRSAINEGRLTERHARTLLRIRDEGTQLELIQRIRNEGLSVKETEDAVEKILDRLYEEEDPQPKQQRQSRRVGILRDGRLVVNSLQQLMEQFNSCGFESSYKMKDKGEFFEISIKVNKVQTKIRSVG